MRLVAFNNGYCVSNAKYVNTEAKSRQVKFPATFFYLEIKGKKIILDTGYSTLINKSSSMLINIYSKLIKAKCIEKASVTVENYGIDPKSIDYVILSHLHPDHYGGLKCFENSKIIMSEIAYRLLKGNKFEKMKNLIFNECIPEDIDKRTTFIESFDKKIMFSSENESGIEVFDILGLNEIYAIHLEGHSNGHIGLFIKSMDKLLIFDAVWCKENLENKEPRKIAKKLVFSDPSKYYETIEIIKKIIENVKNEDNKELDIIISHDERFNRSPYEL